MNRLVCVLEPLGVSEGPEVVRGLALETHRITRVRSVALDLDSTRWPAYRVPQDVVPLSAGLSELAGLPGPLASPAPYSIDGPLVLAGGGCALQEVWQAIEDRARRTGFALPVLQHLRDVLERAVPGERAILMHAAGAPGPVPSSVWGPLVALSHSVVLVVPKAATRDLRAVLDWVQGILDARGWGQQSIIVVVTGGGTGLHAHYDLMELQEKHASIPILRWPTDETRDTFWKKLWDRAWVLDTTKVPR